MFKFIGSKITKLITRLIDGYLQNHYLENNYIHKSLIKEEISYRIKQAVEDVTNSKNQEMDEQLNVLNLKHQIKEDGFKAEIENYKKIVDDAKRMRKDVENLYYALCRRAKSLAIVTMENSKEGKSIIENVSTSIGRLDRIGNNILELIEEIENNEDKELRTLNIRKVTDY